jgi:GNAT superfamily N-acetyltransferase
MVFAVRCVVDQPRRSLYDNEDMSDNEHTVTVRDAVAADASALVPLLEALGYPSDAHTIAARFETLCAADPSGRVLVAEHRSRVVGFVTVHMTPVLHRPTSVGRITGIAVVADARGTGAGRALVAAAESYCRGAGLARIEVTSGVGHVDAYDFYRHLGYEDHGVRFAKMLT